jgi:small GTP-binding protein
MSGNFDNSPPEASSFPPYYGGENKIQGEVLDFSELHISAVEISGVGDDYEPETLVEDNDDDGDEGDEDRFTRGRSRSRSVHSNDDDGGAFVYQPGATPESGSENSDEEQGKSSNSHPTIVERTGPLQHREVIALQKGLEEAATNSLAKGHAREDEEERMAADAEKRKRMLAANHQASSSSEPSKRFRLLILGDSAVGKSSLILRWTQDTFTPSLTSTVGVTFKSKKVQYCGEWIQIQVWDTAGQENFHKITTSYYRNAQGIMLVYDVSEPKSLENVEYWIKNIKANASESVHIALVGNKIDLRDDIKDGKPCIDTEKGKEVAASFEVSFYETSAKDSLNVDEAFMTLIAEISQRIAPPSATRSSITTGRTGMDNNNSVSPAVPSNNNKSAEKKDKSRIFGLLRRKSGSSPDFKTHNSSNNTSENGSRNGTPSGDDKEKCTIS